MCWGANDLVALVLTRICCLILTRDSGCLRIAWVLRAVRANPVQDEVTFRARDNERQRAHNSPGITDHSPRIHWALNRYRGLRPMRWGLAVRNGRGPKGTLP